MKRISDTYEKKNANRQATKKYYTDLVEKTAQEIFKEVKRKNIRTQDKLNFIKKNIAKKNGLNKIPTNIDILNSLPKEKKQEYLIFTTKPGRTSSGVAVVAIMSYPFECPHGKCTTCPGGPSSFFGDIPQSYTGKEPATIRAIRNDYDPYLQVMNRLEQYTVINQIPEKIELIVMGGTFPSFDRSYQEDFIRSGFKAMNDFSKKFFTNDKKTGRTTIDRKRFNDFFELPGEVNDKDREIRIKQKLLELKKKNKKDLEEEQKRNENSCVKCVGLTVETRPDHAGKKVGDFLLKLGCTRVELGIQSVNDDMLESINRGHSVQDSVDAIKELKDLGFKLNFHYMLGLPGWTKKRDVDGLKQLFSDERFRPDMLKIYPCMVLQGTELYNDWKKKNFRPITTKEAADIIYEFKKYVPEYCRIMRVQRDIPTKMTEAGVDRTNLRQYIDKMNPKCRCIRCREVEKRFVKDNIKPKKTELVMRDYDASDGKEYFISFEDKEQDILIGFTRLRFPSKNLRKEITKDSALIRELHVYGTQVSIGQKGKIQHKGFGRKLLKKAEDVAKKNNKKKMVIISGVGVRGYYRKFGYKKQGPYMIKTL